MTPEERAVIEAVFKMSHEAMYERPRYLREALYALKKARWPLTRRDPIEDPALPSLTGLTVERRIGERIQSYRRFFHRGLFVGDPEGCWWELEREALDTWEDPR